MKKLLSVLFAFLMLFSLISVSSAEEPIVDLTVWGTNNGFLPVEKGSPLYEKYVEITGVGVIQPYVEWNGGTTYNEQLNLKIAAGEMPDMFNPNGMETTLIQSGALLDLTPYLETYAPNLYNLIGEEVWSSVKANDPTGQGKIWYVPGVIYGRNAPMIRKDWLDKLGLEMPKTQSELVDVLKAFAEKDPNGNGIMDELPSGGRAEARWMGQFFAMYGVAMWEGYPQWDLYDGELTYSAVTPNMKDALQFIAKLYQDGLLDPETLLNNKAQWDGKINAGNVGIWEHIPQECYNYAEAIYEATGTQPDVALLPVIDADGYEGRGFYTGRKLSGIEYVVANTEDEAKIMAVMKLLNAYGDTSKWMDFYNGVEGMHSVTVDGVTSRLPDDKATQQNLVLTPYNTISTAEFQVQLLSSQLGSDREWAISQAIRNVQELGQYTRLPAGDGIPNSIYGEFADIMNRTLYVEYATKIITGEYSIDKFDEFVEKWYANGGQAVTENARAWYAAKQ
ncbi:MAG: extracellular solute-binding protein [Clostridia bacterium]|nr:extracellular solute-binding protein [Clostridia bacterium]